MYFIACFLRCSIIIPTDHFIIPTLYPHYTHSFDHYTHSFDHYTHSSRQLPKGLGCIWYDLPFSIIIFKLYSKFSCPKQCGASNSTIHYLRIPFCVIACQASPLRTWWSGTAPSPPNQAPSNGKPSTLAAAITATWQICTSPFRPAHIHHTPLWTWHTHMLPLLPWYACLWS